MRVRVNGGGTANWSTPIRVDENTWKANYETFLLHRYTFDDGTHVHCRTRYAGIDVVNAAGQVVGGEDGCIGNFEGMDDDGHWNHGRIDWIITDDYQGAVYNFLYGTGKWEGCSGSVRAEVWAEPERFGQTMPPTTPIRYWGHVDGEGELDLPNFRR
jgi:hypothetical protein